MCERSCPLGAIKVKRVVIDTNVVVSGLLFRRIPGEFVTLWKSGQIRPLCSREIIEECLKVLAYPKFILLESEIDFILTNEILPWFEVITVKAGMPFVKADPSDDKFIWCALTGKAKAIISGDDHLSALDCSPIPILTATEFLRRK